MDMFHNLKLPAEGRIIKNRLGRSQSPISLRRQMPAYSDLSMRYGHWTWSIKGMAGL